MSKDTFVPHKNVPGPARLDMELADNSGSVNSDPMFVADRLAIINHVMAYSYLIDEGRWDDWFALFSDDIVFENTSPELGTLILKGKNAFKDLVEHRYIIPGKNAKGVRRHTQGNVHVAEQTANTAKVRTYMLITSVPAADSRALVPATLSPEAYGWEQTFFGRREILARPGWVMASTNAANCSTPDRSPAAAPPASRTWTPWRIQASFQNPNAR